jgi:hypothetical protein
MGSAGRRAASRSAAPWLGDALEGATAAHDAGASPFDGGPYERLPAPLGGVGADLRTLRRRALVAVGVTWVPLAVLTAMEGLAIRDNPRESFLLDVSAYGRYLIALPLLILAEHVALPILGRIVSHFATSGLVSAGDRARFDMLAASTRALMHSRIAAIVLLGLAYTTTLQLAGAVYPAGISSWAAPIADGVRTYSLAGWWRLLVSQPLYLMMIGVWVWRAIVWGVFLYRVTRMELRLVAAHPDHMGGLQFVTMSVFAFPLVAFALSAGIAANIAERVLFDGEPVTAFMRQIVAVLAIVLVLFLGPLLTLRGPLKELRGRGIFAYGELGSDLGHRFEARWVRPGRSVPASALEAPDFSAVTDAYQIIEHVRAIRLIPIDLKWVAPLVLSALAPFASLLLLVLPMEDLLQFAANFLL